MTMSRTTRATSALLLAVCGIGAGLSANAAVVPGAVDDVRIEEKTADTWSQVKLYVDWRVPDGTAAGDTFTLELPAQLEATDGARFPLNDESGRAVANAVVDGRRVTFTMTDYAETHVGVHGAAWFWVEFADGVKGGDVLDLVFRVGSTTYRDSVTINRPGPGNPDYPYKWQAWMKAAPDSDGERVLWAITGPGVAENMVGSTYEIVDTPGDGQRIDCAKIDVFSGRVGGSPAFADPTYVAKGRWNLECTPTKATVTITPTRDEIGRAFRLMGQSRITDPTLTEYSNAGTVRLWGKAELPVSSVIRAGGGGVGTGVTPAPTTTSPATSPTTNPGTPAPSESSPATETQEPQPSQTGPTTQPGSPAPSESSPATETQEPQPSQTGPTTQPGSPAPTGTATNPGAPAPTPTVTVTATETATSTVTVTSPPVIVGGGSPAPTQTAPGAPAPTTTAPATTPIPTVTAPGIPVTTVAPGTTPTPTTSVTVPVSGGTPAAGAPVRGGAPVAPVAQGAPVAQAHPQRIDTGVPAEGIDMRLAGAGALLALAGGGGLIAVSRRKPRTEES